MNRNRKITHHKFGELRYLPTESLYVIQGFGTFDDAWAPGNADEPAAVTLACWFTYNGELRYAFIHGDREFP